MKFKRYLFLVLILLVLLGISAASAADESTGDILSTHDNQEIILGESISEDALNDNNDEELILEENNDLVLDSAEDEIPRLNEGETTPGTFTDLQNLIDTSETGEITLSRNYTYNNDTDYERQQGIIINRTVSINGNGAVIDGSNNATIFTITANNVKINNITFQNAINYYYEGEEIAYSDGGAIVWNGANGNLNNSNFNNNIGNNGGAINWAGENGKIDNSNFTGNHAKRDGGAISWTGEDGKIYNSNFTQNNATNEGGAIYWYGNNGNLNNSNFTGNTAKDGGAIYLFSNNGTINNSNFNNNNASEGGGAIWWITGNGTINNSNFTQNTASIRGGAIYYYGVNGTINNSNFNNNTAKSDGGAIHWYGVNGNLNNSNFNNNTASESGGAILWSGANGTINNSNFNNNTAKDGGAIYWYGENGNLNNSNFTGNTASESGGAIYWHRRNGNLNNSNFNNNTGKNAGAIYWGGENGNLNNSNFTQNTATGEDNTFGYGGAIYWNAANGKINNSNFNNNNATHDGGAIYWNATNGNINNSNFNNNHVTTEASGNGNGGALYWTGNDGVVDKSKFIGNTATNKGGAIYIYEHRNLKANNNIFLNNPNPIDSDYGYGYDIDYNWWGNVASNYTIKPFDDCNNWLFLNGTANPETIEVLSASEVNFKLFLYTPQEGAEGNVTDYDNSQLPVIQLALSSTKGTIDKENAGLGEIITYTSDAFGSGSVTAMIENIEQTIELEITEGNPDIIFEDQETTYNGSTTINIQYQAEATGKVNVKLEGEQFNYTITDLDLNTVIPLGDINSDTYTVTVEYLGDEKFIKVNATGTLAVKKAQTEIIPTTDTINMSIGDTSNIGYSLDPKEAVRDIVFTSNNENVVTVDSTGAIKATGVGTATISLALSSINYEAPNVTVTVAVSKKDTKITAAAVTTTYNINKNLVITLKDGKGNPLSGAKITVTIGKTKTYTTDKNGQVKINTATLVPKTYTAKISFAGNDKYLKSAKSAKVVVKKAKPKLTAKKKTFKRKTKVKKYSIVLKTNKKKALKKVKLTLKVKGKTYKAKTNSKGKAVFKIKNLKKKGKFNAVVKFAGNKYYKKASKKVRITVKK